MNENAIFQEARDQFLASLAPHEYSLLSQCSSPDEIIRDIKNFKVINKNRLRGQRLLENVTAFSDNIKPYFKVVDTLVQSYPEYAALVWGTTRLVLQMASNFITFFDKLTTFLHHLAQQLPSYQEILSMPNIRWSSQLRSSICNVYVDLFRFFQGVVRVFRKADGIARGTPSVIGGLLWKSFDVRFKEVTETFVFHRQVVEHELVITQLRSTAEIIEMQARENQLSEEENMKAAAARDQANLTSADMKRMQEEKHVDDKFRQIRDWLAPPEFARAFEDAQDLREDGTSRWLFDEPLFQDWIRWRGAKGAFDRQFGENALWIRGNPGCGKTVLAVAAIEQLRRASYHAPHSPPDIFYYFFDSKRLGSEANDASQRAILSQVLHAHRRDRNLIDRFAFAMENTSYGQLTASSHEVQDLFQICLPINGQNILVIDGIDECVDCPTMVEDLLRLTGNPDVKVIFFGRPAGLSVASMLRAMPVTQHLEIGKSTCSDIRLYLARNIEMIMEEGLIRSDMDTDTVVDRLCHGADGMFLWARLMISYLRSLSFSPAQRMKIINNVSSPEGLDDMYERILGKISKAGLADQVLAKEVLIWLALSKRPLTKVELQQIVKCSTLNEADDDIANFSEVVVTICAGLVELDASCSSERPTASFRLIHLTVKEHCLPFVSKNHDTGSWLSSSRHLPTRQPRCEIQITHTCLQFLLYSVPSQPLSGKLGTEASLNDVNKTFPLCSYAAAFWIHHLHSTMTDLPLTTGGTNCITSEDYKELLLTAAQFLSQKLALMAWVEASYISSHPPAHDKLLQWALWAEKCLERDASLDAKKVIKDALEFSKDLERLKHDWNEHLSKSPASIWKQVTAFTPSRFLAQSTAVRFTTLAPDSLCRGSTSTKYLCKVSEANYDEQFVGILSIWPSSSFERFAEHRCSLDRDTDLRSICSGWYARYEAWSIESAPVRLCDIQIPLESGQIWLLVRQSLNIRSQQPFKIRFPIAIALNARTFAILQKVYIFQSTRTDARLKLSSSLFPVEFDRGVQERWSLNYEPADNLCFDMYLYHLSFSSDSRFLCFIDQFGVQNNLAVFEISISGRLAINLVGSLKVEQFMTDCAWNRNCKVTFHPQRALLAIMTAGLAYLWQFGNDSHENPQDRANPIGVHRLIRMEAEPGAREIEFSACGRMIVTTYSSHPEIRPIPGSITRSQKTGYWPTDSSSPSDTPRKSALALWKPEGDIIGPCHMTTLVSGEGQLARTSITNSAVGLSYWAQNASGEMQQSAGFEAIVLPSWPEVHTTAASVIWPQSRDELIRIVLNKTPQPWYGFENEMDAHFPAVIDQDQRLIKRTSGPKPLPPKALENPTPTPQQLVKGNQSVAFEEASKPNGMLPSAVAPAEEVKGPIIEIVTGARDIERVTPESRRFGSFYGLRKLPKRLWPRRNISRP